MARKGMVVTGVVVGIAGVVVGGGLLAAGVLVEGQTVEGFARAPVGCTTTLEFDTADTFTLYVETKGTTDDLGGDCEASGASHSRADETAPLVELVLVDSSDAAVTLGAPNDFRYDTGDFVGSSFATAEIGAPGTYRLTVTSDDTDFAIAVGRDPSADSAMYFAAGLTLGGLGVLIGAVLIVLGAIAKPATPPPSPVAPGPPMSAWTQGVTTVGGTTASTTLGPYAPPTPVPPTPGPLLPPGTPLPPPPPPV